MRPRTTLAIPVITAVILAGTVPALAQRYELRMEVLPTGDAHVVGAIRPTLADYNQIKGAFPNPYPLLRDLTRSRWAAENGTISYEDARHQLTFSLDIRGLAVNMGEHWEVRDLGDSLSQVSAHGREVVLAVHDRSEDQDLLTTLVLPAGARDIAVDPERSVVVYRYRPPAASRPAAAAWALVVLGALLVVAGVFAPVLQSRAETGPGGRPGDAPLGNTGRRPCPACKAPLPDGDIRFCPHCGTPVGG